MLGRPVASRTLWAAGADTASALLSPLWAAWPLRLSLPALHFLLSVSTQIHCIQLEEPGRDDEVDPVSLSSLSHSLLRVQLHLSIHGWSVLAQQCRG